MQVFIDQVGDVVVKDRRQIEFIDLASQWRINLNEESIDTVIRDLIVSDLKSMTIEGEGATGKAGILKAVQVGRDGYIRTVRD